MLVISEIILFTLKNMEYMKYLPVYFQGYGLLLPRYTSLFDRSVRPGEHLVLGKLIWTQLQCMRFIPFKNT